MANHNDIRLKLNFFGGQFRGHISDGVNEFNSEIKLKICSYDTYEFLIKHQDLDKVIPVVWTIDLFIRWLEHQGQNKLTWNKAIYILKSIYNPETLWGEIDQASGVIQSIADFDLYFSLVILNLKRNFLGRDFVTFEQIVSNDFVYKKLKLATQNLFSKIERNFNEQDSYLKIIEFAAGLINFLNLIRMM